MAAADEAFGKQPFVTLEFLLGAAPAGVVLPVRNKSVALAFGSLALPASMLRLGLLAAERLLRVELAIHGCYPLAYYN